MTLSNTIMSVSAAAQLSNTLDLTSASSTLQYRKAITLANGTGLGQADKVFSDTRTLTASSAEDLDLAGVLVDALGSTLTFARVKGLVIEAASTNTNNVIVGGAASNGFISWVGAAAHTVTVRPGGVLALFASDATAYAVTAATADLLHIANSGAGTSVTYNVVIIGSSA
jgi:hypothetical protein